MQEISDKSRTGLELSKTSLPQNPELGNNFPDYFLIFPSFREKQWEALAWGWIIRIRSAHLEFFLRQNFF